MSAATDAILDRLTTLHPKVIDLSLDRLTALLADLGDPQDAIPPVIHVAGTNGKSSTVRMIDEDGTVTTLAGQAGQCGSNDGSPGVSRLCAPSGIAVEGELHGVAQRREGALHEPPQAGVVVDVEDARHLASVSRRPGRGSGSPSRRLPPARPARAP